MEDPAPYLDPSQPVEHRVGNLLGRLTLEEKVSLVHGDTKFSTPAIPRLRIPARWMTDGPNGVREETGPHTWTPAGRTDDFATAMPCLLALAAAWNPELAQACGAALGSEARHRGKQILLAPGMNLQRTPLNGRNFEYLGEDPWLASRIAVGYIRGIQSQGVPACAKHFAANNQEKGRMTVNVEMDERALRELYLPAFKAAVREAGVHTIMAAYNRFRGEFCSQNDYLLNRVLKKEWGFQGIVISDWNAVHDTGGAALGGLDLEMGTELPYGQYYLAGSFLDGLKRGEYPMALLDDKVRRNLRQMFAAGAFDPPGPAGAINTPEHQAVARQVAAEGMVLLKNEGAALPIDPGAVRSIAVIGENATRLQCYRGGSTKIKAFHEITPLEGIIRRAGRGPSITFALGYASDEPGADRQDAGVLRARAVEAARAADVAIVVAGLDHTRHYDAEEADRIDLRLPFGQDELIRSVAAVNPRTVVVLISGGALEMDAWLEQVPAVLQAWYAGMEGGNALAGILFGDTSPSGKLPCTFPKKLSDSPAHALDAYPGRDGREEYAEGLLVGYRWFDTRRIEPLFPFGFGLSYTRFDYSDLRVARETSPGAAPAFTVSFTVENAGTRAGAETAQVYVRPGDPSVPRPLQELKGFRKVFLGPGEKTVISIPLAAPAFSFYDPEALAWKAEKGEYFILAGGSSRDLPLAASIRLEATTVTPD